LYSYLSNLARCEFEAHRANLRSATKMYREGARDEIRQGV